MEEGDPRAVSARLSGSVLQATGSGWRSPPISAAAALRKFVPFDEPLERLHCLVEELEIPEE
jgi:hypothetical protein